MKLIIRYLTAKHVEICELIFYNNINIKMLNDFTNLHIKKIYCKNKNIFQHIRFTECNIQNV